MKRLLAGLALTAALGATPSMAFDPVHRQQLLSTKSCPWCDLTDANLVGADLRYANLVFATLSGAQLDRADMSFSNLVGVALVGANLTSANLVGVTLGGANLTDANLAGADLAGANLVGALLSGATICNTTWIDGNIRSENCRESDYQERFCVGMEQNFAFADNTRPDCMSAEYVIEVDFTDKWKEAIGQALHYALMSGREAGIILVCESDPGDDRLCRDHSLQLQTVVREYNLPITVWNCGHEMEFLSQCRKIESVSEGSGL